MIFEEKTIILKDGRTAILKSPCVEDAEKLLNERFVVTGQTFVNTGALLRPINAE